MLTNTIQAATQAGYLVTYQTVGDKTYLRMTQGDVVYDCPLNIGEVAIINWINAILGVDA